jgi:syntaxin 7
MSYTRLTNDGGLSPLREDISNQSNRVQSLIFQLQTNVSTFKRLVDQLGTARDTKDQRAKLHKLREQIGAMAKESSVLVKKLAKMVTDLVHEEQDQEYNEEYEAGEDDAESLAERHKKLVKDLHATLKDFQRAQRACAERESTFLPQKENVGGSPQGKSKKKGYGATGGNDNSSAAAAAAVAMSGERGGQFYQGTQMVDEGQQHAPLLMEHKSQGQKEMTAVEIDMRFNDQLIEERERGIAEIQQQIGEVNEIFQDLAVLVNEQGNMIDDIEANIVSTAMRTKEAQKELTKADKSQKSARNKMVCLAITVFTALIILILFLLQ